MKKIKLIVTAQNFGAANATAPLIDLAYKKEYDVLPLASKQAEIVYGKERGFPYKIVKDYGFNPDPDKITSKIFKEILSKEKPNIIITGSSTEEKFNGIEKCALLASKELEIPSICVLDNWGDRKLRFKNFENGENYACVPKKITLIDNSHKKLMEQDGFDPQILIVTGNPYFDCVKEKSKKFTQKEKQDIIKEIGGKKAEFTFLYLGNSTRDKKPERGYWDLDNIQTIYHALKNYPLEQLETIISIHKRHPKDQVDEIKEYLRETEGRMRLIEKTKPTPLQMALTLPLTVTPFSTTGLEAVIAGNYCISMQPNAEEDRMPTNEAGITYRIEKNEDFESALRKIIQGKGYELTPNLKDFRQSLDGKATERIVDLIPSLL